MGQGTLLGDRDKAERVDTVQNVCGNKEIDLVVSVEAPF